MKKYLSIFFLSFGICLSSAQDSLKVKNNVSTDSKGTELAIDELMQPKGKIVQILVTDSTSYTPPPNIRTDTLIKTTIFTIDLSQPKTNSVTSSNKLNKLVYVNRSPVSIQIINGNPFRYDYSLNYQAVNLFFDENLVPFDKDGTSSIKDGVDLIIPKIDDGKTVDPKSIINDQITLVENIEYVTARAKVDIASFKLKNSLDIEELNDLQTKYYNTYIEYVLNRKEIIKSITKLKKTTPNQIIDNQKVIDKLFEEMIPIVNQILSAETSTYLLPIDTNGDNIDYIEVTLQRTDKTNNVSQQYIYKLWIRGGVKIDFSGGGFITSIFDNNYVLTNALDDMGMPNGKQTILKQDAGDYDFGFGATVNLSLRGGSWVKPSFNVGALFTSNQKFQLLTGLGLIVGKNERFIINFGLSMGRVSVLQDNFIADNQTQYDLGTDGNIPLVDKFEFGHFFGITYNFNKPKSQNE